MVSAAFVLQMIGVLIPLLYVLGAGLGIYGGRKIQRPEPVDPPKRPWR